MSDRGYTEKEIEEVKRRLYYSYLYDKSAKASAIPDAGILFRYIADLEAAAEKFRAIWGTLQAFQKVWVTDYADPADREEDLRKESCRIAQYVDEFACVQHDWTPWTEDTFFRSRSCEKCAATESVRIKQSPENLRNYEKWKADSERLDKLDRIEDLKVCERFWNDWWTDDQPIRKSIDELELEKR